MAERARSDGPPPSRALLHAGGAPPRVGAPATPAGSAPSRGAAAPERPFAWLGEPQGLLARVVLAEVLGPPRGRAPRR